MTAARLSPAASLLRNSKLFALPPAIALPNPEPSSEPVPRSDTATTIYPTRAAIETPLTSLGRGDWGFKRQLPLKSTTKSGSPSVRLNKGIDTAEHIADFDSAADHVLTLKKFQELNLPIQFPSEGRSKNIHQGVFRAQYDNTTKASKSIPSKVQYSGVWPSLSPADLQKHMPDALQSDSLEQPAHETQSQQPLRSTDPKRWRYGGPSLVQMSGLEFDQWMKSLNNQKRQAFREVLKQDLLFKKRQSSRVRAQDEGTIGEIDVSKLEVTEEEVRQHLRRLRQHPESFGRLIAEFLDLPPGPSTRGITVQIGQTWDYGSNTLAAERYTESGPPRTHPSAGLSYIHSARWAQNHAIFGPQEKHLPVIARQVKTKSRNNQSEASLGVAGFIVENEGYKGTRERATAQAFTPQSGGQKTSVTPIRAEVNEKGALKITVKAAGEYLVEGEKAVHNSMVSDAQAASQPSAFAAGSKPRVMPALVKHDLDYKKREDLASNKDEDLDFLGGNRGYV